MGRMFRCVELGSGIGLGWTAPSGWRGFGRSLAAGLEHEDFNGELLSVMEMPFKTSATCQH